MPRPLSVALLGFWHVHAGDYARSVLAHPDTELVAAWDPDADRGRAGAAEFDVPFEADLDALLARDDLDAVVVTTSTDQHPDVLMRAAAAGKHIFTEKLLAGTVAEAESILHEAERRDVKVVVSLPRLAEPIPLAVKRILDGGSLGDITYTRVRLAHDGWAHDWLPERFGNRAEALGGALADLGCHPAYLTQLFLGSHPSTVSASYTASSGRAVEDNAVVTTTYPSGALGVFEASFVTTPGAFSIEVRGTEGSLLHGFGNDDLRAKGTAFPGNDWSVVDEPEAAPEPFAVWVDAIRTGTVATENLRAAVELTRLVAAANESAEQGVVVRYPAP
ncbi:Gfo/Idh/MocA family protein [Planctomonas psychrotolerans]|uniref:Gfo/Idh/MocA family protein n=1 Tax=Planctomonas psychrotolerans TaxID=2528712 RepID=UPI00123AD5B8|nr:Gfo/Idh/MocA family oxidoreductase [Planctomonas psychrotolerans]